METRWLYLSGEELEQLREISNDTCIIPMGCIEKHSLHLPLGTDIIHTSHIAFEASKLECACVFPDFTFGDIPAKMKDAPVGSVCISAETQMILLEELCESISRWGFKKILVYNGHGGNNPWLATFKRNLGNKNIDYILATVMMDEPIPHTMAELILKNGSGYFPELTKEDEELIIKYHNQEGFEYGHACINETAYIMGISPESVHMDKLGIESGKCTHKSDYFTQAGISLASGGYSLDYPNSYAGDDPYGCNERIGAAALRLEAERLANAIKVYKEDKYSLLKIPQKK